MTQVFLLLITSDLNYEDVDELTKDLHNHNNIDGIYATLHSQSGDAEKLAKMRALLEERKGLGHIVVRDFIFNHAHSMNECLFRIPLGSCVVLRDSLERVNDEFASQFRNMAKLMVEYKRGLVQRSKVVMFPRLPEQHFFGGIHWGLHSPYTTFMDISQLNEAAAHDRFSFYSVRNEKRSKDHRYDAEARYIVEYGANGNHFALFARNYEEYVDLYQANLNFLLYLKENNIHTLEEFKTLLKDKNLFVRFPLVFVEAIQKLRPLRNFYRYRILGHSDEEICQNEDTYILS